MSSYDQNKTRVEVSYPSTPPNSYAAPLPAPPPYPIKDGNSYPPFPSQTKPKGDGFWRGCGYP
ncbi:conserved hypothetical protein [Ricinus communis]|uniref:Uncharacterized protein n=1 Tax=Ricinus communis TaxID=3988 RepID=B9RE84_RICCO|nr:conserved hypothetical protein [Ricinus communis]